jgi:hypothetical protein
MKGFKPQQTKLLGGSTAPNKGQWSRKKWGLEETQP